MGEDCCACADLDLNGEHFQENERVTEISRKRNGNSDRKDLVIALKVLKGWPENKALLRTEEGKKGDRGKGGRKKKSQEGCIHRGKIPQREVSMKFECNYLRAKKNQEETQEEEEPSLLRSRTDGGGKSLAGSRE